MDTTLEIFLWVLLTLFLHLIVFLCLIKKSPKSISGRHVVITGGSQGIGLHVAINCAKLGANVTIVARNVEMLERAKKLIEANRKNETQRIEYRSCDLSEKYELVEQTFQFIEAELGDIYMLVNCAGIAICGTIEDISIDNVHRMMNVNYFATYYPLRYVLKKMKKSREGIIVITSSQAGLLGIYGYGPYASAKFALRGLAETVAMETKHLNISVTLALPADTDTPGFEIEEKTKPIETKLISASAGLADPKDVGKKILYDALKGSFFSIYGFESWMLTLMCVGMSPWKGPILNIIQVVLAGPLRAIGLFVQWNFYRIVRNCVKDKKE